MVGGLLDLLDPLGVGEGEVLYDPVKVLYGLL